VAANVTPQSFRRSTRLAQITWFVQITWLVACGSTSTSSTQPGATTSSESTSTANQTTASPAPAPGTPTTPTANSTTPSTPGSSPGPSIGETASEPATSTTPGGGTSDTDTSSAPESDVSTPPGGNDGCTVGDWPAADPALAGPYEVVTDTNVGPTAGEGEDGGAVAFTVFRPKDLELSGRCHPVITWGNGTGSNPGLYKVLLGHLASHGFVVVASDSPNVAQGDPPPMVAGVDWLLEENNKQGSPYFQRIDTNHVGATGHSQGGFATTQAGGDSHITTIAPLCGASSQRNLHGPALLLCGGADDVVDCEGIANALDSFEQPAMLANYITADHANWVTFRGTTLSPMEVATTAWMRVHLMDDAELRSWFYGASCKLCEDDEWEITQKMMDE
jgi:hypothetical protein